MKEQIDYNFIVYHVCHTGLAPGSYIYCKCGRQKDMAIGYLDESDLEMKIQKINEQIRDGKAGDIQ